ncbi:MAG: ABC transporter permease [Thermoflexus hugenholtzii]|jgi:ribose transport system permease protein|uniref:ABC transporter permease n=1 Tax=Thermoflexus TaxID=1495649 RepID=UPI001AFE64A3|nr:MULTISPECIES: ABC transporter permease [Thermoflexus]MBO9361642.1 ABC transporter permease [Thermoflexus sp.]QWK10226.1 MAG: ABC transporter permease [Thermoflexus hugenholtzii]
MFELREFLGRWSGALVLAMLWLALAALTPQFLTPSNLLNVALQSSILAVVAMGMTMTIISGGIDLSVGSVVALTGALAAGWMVRDGWPVGIAIAAALGVGLILGALNGALVVYGRLAPFIATLSTMAIARGLTLVYTRGYPISGLPDSFTFLGTGDLAGIPMPVLVMLFVALVVRLLLHRTAWGLHLYAIGGGEELAWLSGVRVRRVKGMVYALSGLLAALGGILLTARLWSAQPNVGVGLELEAIAASVLGGARLSGGYGRVEGTLIGALVMATVGNGLNLLEVPSYHQQVIKGLVFILAVGLDRALQAGVEWGRLPRTSRLIRRRSEG